MKGLQHGNHIGTLAITPDGKLALSGNADGLTVWDLRKRRPIHFIDSAPLHKELGTNLGIPSSIAMLPRGSGVACTYAESSCVALWNLKRGNLKQIKHYDIQGLYGAVLVTPDGCSVLLNYYESQSLDAVDLRSGQRPREGIAVVTNEASILDAATTADQRCLAARDWAGTVFYWDCRSGICELIQEIGTGHEYCNGRIYISPRGRYFAIAEPELRVWDAQTGRTVLEGAGGGALAFGPDERSLIFQEYVSGDSYLEMYMLACDLQTGQHSASFEGSNSAAGAMAISPDGKLLMSGHIDGAARFWDPKNHKLLDAIGHNGEYRG